MNAIRRILKPAHIEFFNNRKVTLLRLQSANKSLNKSLHTVLNNKYSRYSVQMWICNICTK